MAAPARHPVAGGRPHPPSTTGRGIAPTPASTPSSPRPAPTGRSGGQQRTLDRFDCRDDAEGALIERRDRANGDLPAFEYDHRNRL